MKTFKWPLLWFLLLAGYTAQRRAKKPFQAMDQSRRTTGSAYDSLMWDNLIR